MTTTTLDTNPRRRSNLWALLIAAFVLLVVLAWTQGVFDNFLWRFGLNYNDCATNGFGATFCGDALEHYKQNLGIK